MQSPGSPSHVPLEPRPAAADGAGTPAGPDQPGNDEVPAPAEVAWRFGCNALASVATAPEGGHPEGSPGAIQPDGNPTGAPTNAPGGASTSERATVPGVFPGAPAPRLDEIPAEPDLATALRSLLHLASRQDPTAPACPIGTAALPGLGNPIPGTDALIAQVIPGPVASPPDASAADNAGMGEGAFLALAVASGRDDGGAAAETTGTAAALEAARKLVCAGATVLGIATGAPVASADGTSALASGRVGGFAGGVAAACRALGVAFIPGAAAGGGGGNRQPVATVAAIGRIDERAWITGSTFRDDGDAILLLGPPVDLADPLQGLGASEWLRQFHPEVRGSVLRCDLEQSGALHEAVRSLIRGGGIKSATACGAGGLAVGLARACGGGATGDAAVVNRGADVDLGKVEPGGGDAGAPVRTEALLFGETPNRVVVTCRAVDVGKMLARAAIFGIGAIGIGSVGGPALHFQRGQSQLLTLPAASVESED